MFLLVGKFTILPAFLIPQLTSLAKTLKIILTKIFPMLILIVFSVFYFSCLLYRILGERLHQYSSFPWASLSLYNALLDSIDPEVVGSPIYYLLTIIFQFAFIPIIMVFITSSKMEGIEEDTEDVDETLDVRAYQPADQNEEEERRKFIQREIRKILIGFGDKIDKNLI